MIVAIDIDVPLNGTFPVHKPVNKTRASVVKGDDHFPDGITLDIYLSPPAGQCVKCCREFNGDYGHYHYLF